MFQLQRHLNWQNLKAKRKIIFDHLMKTSIFEESFGALSQNTFLKKGRGIRLQQRFQ